MPTPGRFFIGENGPPPAGRPSLSTRQEFFQRLAQVETEFLDLLVQGRPADLEDLAGPGLAPLDGAQDVLDVLLLDLLEGTSSSEKDLPFVRLQRQVLLEHDVALGQDDGPGQGVLELTDVAPPGQVDERSS
ncbi:MAG: hypothetical protein MZV63_63140 [Marinilabiliales bacterium]|nr:hypothetical protein [Marinilabiliales bacterium]